MRKRNRHGFTLLELLVVVVILGIIAAIMLPKISDARQRASRVACAAQLKGLAFGFRAYLEENDLICPWAAEVPSINTDKPPLPDVMKSQVPDPKGWKCNGDNRGYTRLSDGKSFSSRFEGEATSYEYNQSLAGRKIDRSFLQKFLGDRGVWVLMDLDSFHDKPGENKAKNIAFGDGHVGYADDLTETFNPTSN